MPTGWPEGAGQQASDTGGTKAEEPGGSGRPAASRPNHHMAGTPPGATGALLTRPIPPEQALRDHRSRGDPTRAHGLGPVSLRVRPTHQHPFLKVRVAPWRKRGRALWLFWKLFILYWGIND